MMPFGLTNAPACKPEAGSEEENQILELIHESTKTALEYNRRYLFELLQFSLMLS